MSFFSRLAAANGAEHLKALCHHVGVQHEYLARGERTAVARMAALARTSAPDLQQRSVVSSNGRQFINDQCVASASDGVGRTLQVCPKCICDDLTKEGSRPRAKAWVRLPWLVGWVRTCHIHHVPLVRVGTRHEAGDIALIVQRSADKIAAAASASQERRASDYDAYLFSRLCGDDGGRGFLAELPFYVAVELTEMIGATVIHGDLFIPDYLTDAEWSTAGAVGFEITRHGAQAITDHLTMMALRNRQRRHRNRLYASFGTLQEWLFGDPGNGDYEPIRNLMVMVANAWPRVEVDRYHPEYVSHHHQSRANSI